MKAWPGRAPGSVSLLVVILVGAVALGTLVALRGDDPRDLTARLALGHSLLEAVAGAKSWLTEAIRNAPQLGRGFGPVEHLTPVESK